jgi:hypothetical protein
MIKGLPHYEKPFSIKGIMMYSNPLLERGKGIKTEEGVIAHPFDLATTLLTSGYDYKNVFESMGLTDNTLDASIEYAKRKVQNAINWKSLENTGLDNKLTKW